ncbi:MAG: hypothetical protein GX556_07860 [Fibrobacter sp.]|mgnify:CR=1 FL=1|nr:hypothetical protein [Fibrobacter sp.]
MAFFWRHKILSLIIMALVFYWFYNPSGRFGIARQNFVVYNKIPVAFFDLFVKPNGGMAVELDLREKTNVKYWFDNHLPSYKRTDTDLTLLVGTGFDSVAFELDKKMISVLRERRIIIRQMPSGDAVAAYNTMKESGKPVAVLLKVK